MGRRQVRCHGDDQRFEAMVSLIAELADFRLQHIADAAGGQGALSRLLRKRLNLQSEVIDPRAFVLKGVPHRAAEFKAEDALYYDLVVGLHPDGALRGVVEAARLRPTVLVPCCNFWSKERLGLKELLREISEWYQVHGVRARQVRLGFKGPYNQAFVTQPPDLEV